MTLEEKLKNESESKPKKRGALINFESDVLERIDRHAKLSKVSRTKFVELACIDACEKLERKAKK